MEFTTPEEFQETVLVTFRFQSSFWYYNILKICYCHGET